MKKAQIRLWFDMFILITTNKNCITYLLQEKYNEKAMISDMIKKTL